MDETNRTDRADRADRADRTRTYGRHVDAPRPPLRDHAAPMPYVSTGSMVAMVLGTLLIAILVVWVIA